MELDKIFIEEISKEFEKQTNSNDNSANESNH
jgi:hypothetical protein